MAKKIPLQNGMYAIVDDEDYERVDKYIWYYSRKDNNVCSYLEGNKKVSLSRFVMDRDVPKGNFIIRKNAEYLDYRKNNLDIVEDVNKYYYTGARNNSKSKYKGVYWCKTSKKWRARIQKDKKQIDLGRYEKEEDAAIAYNKAAKEIFGYYAFQNKIGKDNRNRKPQPKGDGAQRKRNKTGYRGVSKSSRSENFMASIDKNFYLGSFPVADQAAKAYDKKAYELYGDKAILNFPELVEEYKKEVGTNQHQKCTK